MLDFDAPPPSAGLRCLNCGRQPAARFRFDSHIGLLVVHDPRGFDGALCRTCARGEYRTHQARTFGVGWLSFSSFFLTPGRLWRNRRAWRRGTARLGEPSSALYGLRPAGRPLPLRPQFWVGPLLASLLIGAIGAIALAVPSIPLPVDVDDLQAGQCFRSSAYVSEQAVDVVFRVGCSRPHLAEVTASPRIPEELGAEYPGELAVIEFAELNCLEAFERYVGLTYEEAWHLDFGYLYPSAETWALGDRIVLCLVVDVDYQPLEDTVRDGNLPPPSGTDRLASGQRTAAR